MNEKEYNICKIFLQMLWRKGRNTRQGSETWDIITNHAILKAVTPNLYLQHSKICHLPYPISKIRTSELKSVSVIKEKKEKQSIMNSCTMNISPVESTNVS